MSIRILHGDCRAKLPELDAGSLQVVICSPPYFNLRQYSGDQNLVWGQICCEHTHEWGDERIRSKGGVGQDKGLGNAEALNTARDGAQVIHQGRYCQHIHDWTENSQCGAWFGSLGNEPRVEMFIDHLVECFQLVKQTLRDDGLLFVNLGDSYSGSNGNGYKQTLHDVNRTSGGNENFDLRRSVDRQDDEEGGSLLEVPSLFAIAMKKDGWILRSRIPVLKKSAMPESVDSRPTSAVEYFFMFAKNSQAQFWTHRDRSGTRIKPEPDYRWLDRRDNVEVDVEPDNWQDERLHDEHKQHVKCDCPKRWRRVNLWKSHNYFWDGDAIRIKSASEGRGSGNLARKENHQNGRSGFAVGIPWEDEGIGRNFRNTDLFLDSWQGLLLNEQDVPLSLVAGQAGFKGAHYATFNPKWIIPFILGATSAKGQCQSCGAPWSRVTEVQYKRHEKWFGEKFDAAGRHNRGTVGKAYNEPVGLTTQGWRPTCDCGVLLTKSQIVCDPFSGAGTVALVSDQLGRDAVGIELSESYKDISTDRLINDAPMFVDVMIQNNTEKDDAPFDEYPDATIEAWKELQEEAATQLGLFL